MYDTTSWTYEFTSPSIKNMDNIAQHFDKVVSETQKLDANNNAYTTLQGYKNGNVVYVNPFRMNCNNYSIAKDCFGSSVMTPTIKDVKQTIEKLNDTWSHNISEATVNRLDIGSTFITSTIPASYLCSFGDAPRHDKSTIKGSLYYQLKDLTNMYYDKKAAMISKKELIPIHFQNKELLRAELRLMRGAKKQLCSDRITLGMLYSPSIFNKSIELLHNRYKSINKLNLIMPIEMFTLSIKDYYAPAFMLLMEAYGGYDNFMFMLDSLSGDKTAKYRLKQQFKKASSYKLENQNNPLIKELDNTIETQLKDLTA